MTKTTIDGLKVRESSTKRHPVSTTSQSSAHVVDMTTRRTTRGSNFPAQKSRRNEMIDSIDQIKQQNSATNFLDPVDTFDFDDEAPLASANDFGKQTEADWSDLLGEMNHKSTKSTRKAIPPRTKPNDDDLLAAWGAEPGDDFLANNAIESTVENTDAADDLEDEEEPKIPRRYQKKLRPRKKHHFGRIFAISTVCLLIIGGGVFYKWGDELISRLTGGRSGLLGAIQSLISEEIPFETDANGRTNVLIFGTEGYNMNGDTAFGEHSGSQLTDSIMVASFDQKTKDVALISLPRDLKVRKACSAGKINEVFWCSNQNGTDEEAGAKALMDQVGDVLGLDFQYYAHINWASLIDIIDTIGGITVTLDEDINDYGWTNAVAKAGVPMEVNGEQALGLARARHGTVGGDFTRGNTQQKIVEGVVSKVVQNGIGPQEALGLMGILGDNLRTNFSTDNIKAGMHLLAGFNIANIRQIPLVDYNSNTFYVTTATINDISYVVPSAGERDYSKIHEYVASMLSNDPVERENARIAIYNASGQYGVAGAEREHLQNDGYDIVNIGDTTLGSCEEQYCVYAVNQNFPATGNALSERYNTTLRDITVLPADITPGETDYIIIIGLGGNST